MFIVALYVPWCRSLAGIKGVTPQMYADNLECTTTDEGALIRLGTGISERLANRPLLPSAFSLAHPRLLGRG